jgi:hypothetical protein
MNLLIFQGHDLIYSSSGRGVSPLLEAIEEVGLEGLKGVLTADRIVGRAAALLNVYMGASAVHALVISAGAEELFKGHGVAFDFVEETDMVKDVDGVLFCPFERLVQGISDPEVAFVAIRDKLAELRA